MDDQHREDLQQACAGAEAVVDGIRSDDLDGPTPCSGWTVGDVLEHLIAGNDLFARALGAPGADGSGPDGTSDGRLDGGGLDAGLAARFRGSTERLVRAVGTAAPDTPVEIPFGRVPAAMAVQLRIAELLTHGWDLARATGRSAEFPEDVVARSLGFSRAALSRIPPGRSPFAPSQPCPGDAPVLDQLAACLGRTPGWSPAEAASSAG